MTWWALQDSNL